jgi:hypothetical protein
MLSFPHVQYISSPKGGLVLTQAGKPKILVLGGYGIFGKRICKTLAKDKQCQVLIAGRDFKKAQNLVNEIKHENPNADIAGIALDWRAEDFSNKLQMSRPTVVIHTAGPFQGQDYKIAQLCIALKIHYIDLADGRDFVTHIGQLDQKAKENEVVVISGASSVPGLSSVIVENFAAKFAILREINIGIASANKIERGDASITAILGYLGKPFQRLEKGKWKTVYGWQNIHRHYYGDNVGLRWHGNCDVPDLVLFPERYPMLNTVTFHAGLEVSFLHFALWIFSWLTRAKIVRNWAFFHGIITRMSSWFYRFGTATGGMYIRMYGSNHRYQPLEIVWNLVAEKGDGPNIPTMPSIILVKKILQGQITPGAQPCFAMFNLEDFYQAIAPFSIYYTVEETEF